MEHCGTTKGSDYVEGDIRDEHYAARYLLVPLKTLRYWRYAELGPDFTMHGGHAQYLDGDLDEFLAVVPADVEFDPETGFARRLWPAPKEEVVAIAK